MTSVLQFGGTYDNSQCPSRRIFARKSRLHTVVHIAPAGRTAKARGVELAASGVKGKGAQWEEGIFENDYVKQDGVWKIQCVHYYARVITDYELGWAKDAKPAEKTQHGVPAGSATDGGIRHISEDVLPAFSLPQSGDTFARPISFRHRCNSGETRAEAGIFERSARDGSTVKELIERLTELERQIDSSIAYDAIENLVSAHGYYLDDFRTAELQGLFVNASNRSSPFSPETGSAAAVHQTVQPVIQLAPDGRSATIRARLLKVDGKAGALASGTYEGRAIRRDGVWKLQDLTLKQICSSAFSRWTPVLERRR